MSNSLIELLTELKKECIHRAKFGVYLAADYRIGFFPHRTKESARFAALEAMKRVEKDRVRAFRIDAEIKELTKNIGAIGHVGKDKTVLNAAIRKGGAA